MRIGIGYDIHRLVRGRRLVLGGVEIPFEKGLLGHSDGDALAHAVIDALLGAAACGDIGTLFPDTDERYKDANSLELLRAATSVIHQKGFRVVNVDATVVAEKPRLAPYVEAMRMALADAMGVGAEAVSVKAKTNEGIGATGAGEAIACLAVALLAAQGDG